MEDKNNKICFTDFTDLEGVINPSTENQPENNKDIPVEEIFDDSSLGLNSNRRDFLKYLGFGITAATLAACEKTPVRYALPYIVKPNDLMPGVPNYYASTFYDGSEYNSILVKTREGRPIKIEGNSTSPISEGGVSTRAHASVLSLYDNARLKGPIANKTETKWEDVDNQIKTKLGELSGKIVLLSHSILSPSTRSLIQTFAEKFKVRHITYDSYSSSAILEANQQCFDKAVLPHYRFDKAKIIVGFNADFLGTWLTPTTFTKQWVKNRSLVNGQKEMSRHYQFETNLSLTGSNADYRAPMKPSDEGKYVLKLYNEIAKLAGQAGAEGGMDAAGNLVSKAAQDLWANKGNGIVVSGSNQVGVQILVNTINNLLGNVGTTIDFSRPSNLRQGKDSEMAKLIEEINAGSVEGLLLYNCNPVYSHPNGETIKNAIGKLKLSVSFSSHIDETSDVCQYVLPDNNYLESWGDAEPFHNSFSIQQPTINHLFNTRQFQQNLLSWLGDTRDPYLFLADYWKNTIFPKTGSTAAFPTFWTHTLHEGILELPAEASTVKFSDKGLSAAIQEVTQTSGAAMELMVYQKVGIGTGEMAGNPWLQELPDPITKATWDNYITVNREDAKTLKVEQGDIMKLEVEGGKSIDLPVIIQPGQTRGTFGIALGYGRTKAPKAALGIGKNAATLTGILNGNWQPWAKVTKATKVGSGYKLALAQTQPTQYNRPIVKETILSEYVKDPQAANHEKFDLVSLWAEHDKNGHYWAMAIDLNACTGCGACVVSCQAENNIPVVGKEEVLVRREMHWMRIDRYYSSEKENIIDASEMPEVVFQPLMCQHCDNASCETVCPVLATVHSIDGLNQQVYNRCVGTRYCANNCAYKVRRFNWLDYTNVNNFQYNPVDDLGRMVLNPDVTVRSRGTMEKCSFCVQRIQAAKIAAKVSGKPLPDGQLQTACSASCPSGAIVFGDLNDPDSQIAKLYKSDRAYRLLEEVKTKPHVSYLVKVRNKDEQTKS
ncbi:MAG: 4Fe-4S dicluster domain-containing protein [Bacteroidia bacterium]|nr:4Fe-4S dicluster domain-containing protein [Bacteroidia bacterium]